MCLFSYSFEGTKIQSDRNNVYSVLPNKEKRMPQKATAFMPL